MRDMLQKMGFRQIEANVRCFVSDKAKRKIHIRNLKFASLSLYNKVIDDLRNRHMKTSWMSFVLGLQLHDVIGDTPNMKHKVSGIENNAKFILSGYYFESEFGYPSRIPNKVRSFKELGKKKDSLKNYVCDVISEIYFVYQESLLEKKVYKSLSEINIDYDAGVLEQADYYKVCREYFKTRMTSLLKGT